MKAGRLPDFLQSFQSPLLRPPLRHVTVVDAFLLVCLAGLAILVGTGMSQGMMFSTPPVPADIHLDGLHLLGYAVRTSFRMAIALGISLVFSFLYALAAARSRRAAQLLVPLLGIFQAIPVLGLLSFTVVFFLVLFPVQISGAELAVICTVVWAQIWVMTSGLYQSLQNVPTELEEAARCFGLTGWQKFWRLDVPCTIPSLVWSAMTSMAGGWFVLIYSETMTVGPTRVVMPGIGSYVAVAISQKEIGAILAAILVMVAVIILYDQVLFRPLSVWAARFRQGGDTQDDLPPEPWMLRLFRHTRILGGTLGLFLSCVHKIASLPIGHRLQYLPRARSPVSRKFLDALWYGVLGVVFLSALKLTWNYGSHAYTLGQVLHVVMLGFYTLFRVTAMLGLASCLWVPVGVWLGLNSARAQRVQIIIQSCSAFPANLLFPVFVAGIAYYRLDPSFWLSVLLMLGAQGYIFSNVMAGTASFPSDLLEVGENFKVTGLRWWRKIILPGILPSYFTGLLAASGSAWNAAIAAESVQWGHETLNAQGLGAYIAQTASQGDLSGAALGVAVMTVFILTLNGLVWRPLSAYACRRLKLI